MQLSNLISQSFNRLSPSDKEIDKQTEQRKRHHRGVAALLFGVIGLSFLFCRPCYSSGNTVAVVFHGVAETGADMVPLATSLAATGQYKNVVVVTYDWDKPLQDVASSVYSDIASKYPNTNFEFWGYSKGGLLAERIAQDIPEADGHVSKIVTIDSPLKGTTDLIDLVATSLNDALATTTASNFEAIHPGLAELLPGTSATNPGAPVNQDSANIDRYRIYGEGDWAVPESSALSLPSGSGGTGKTYELVFTSPTSLTKVYKDGRLFPVATDHTGMRTFLATHKGLLRHLVDGTIPPEAINQPVDFSDETVTSKDQIPAGWIPCQCPDQHQGLGLWFNGTYYHSSIYHCP